MLQYKRILLKLSGESLQGSEGHGIDPKILILMHRKLKTLLNMVLKLALL
jgi:uridylate kinase